MAAAVDQGQHGVRVRLHPLDAERLIEWGRACRAVRNLALEQRQHLYRQRGLTLRVNEQCVQLTQARRVALVDRLRGSGSGYSGWSAERTASSAGRDATTEGIPPQVAAHYR
jgi:hypothetical protein